METNKILNSDFFDILFDGKNKEYGAYDLRKTYNRRISTALVSVGSILLLFLVGSVLANKIGNSKIVKPADTEIVILTPVEPLKPKDVLPPPPPAPRLAPSPQVAMDKFTPPQIVEDDKVTEADIPPVVDDLSNAKIGIAVESPQQAPVFLGLRGLGTESPTRRGTPKTIRSLFLCLEKKTCIRQ